LADRLGMVHVRREVSVDDVAGAGEAMLCSTPSCLVPVVRFNGRPIGAGRPGKIFHELLAAWNETAGVDLAAQAARFAQRRRGALTEIP